MDRIPLLGVLQRNGLGIEFTVVGQRIALETIEAAQHAALMVLAVALGAAQRRGAVIRMMMMHHRGRRRRRLMLLLQMHRLLGHNCVVLF